MAHHIEHRSDYPRPAAAMFATLTDRAFLDDRLAVLGGRQASIIEHDVTDEGASFTLRHSIDGEDLPSGVSALVGGDLTIERQESWHREGDGYAGTVKVSIPGMPGDLSGQQRLSDSPSGSTLVVDGDVAVPIPLFGGKVEESVGGHLRDLLDAEHEFTVTWLADH